MVFLLLQILSFTIDECSCAGIQNQYNEGDICTVYSGYYDDWRNGMWCNVNTTLCTDARQHPSISLPGFGASRDACNSGSRMFYPIKMI